MSRPRERGRQAVVDAPEHDGYTVVVDKLGTAASADCTVDSVRSGQAMNQLVQFGPEHLNQLVDQTVYLTAKC
ncbi:MAG: hypothetical protein JST91_02225 [Actinobacteria bacterium]|nr:hypothetical protein [Actinomycetota bacterium]